jgi:hypothetical protein
MPSAFPISLLRHFLLVEYIYSGQTIYGMKALLYLTHLESQASSSHELCRRTRPWEARLLDRQESQHRCIGIGL